MASTKTVASGGFVNFSNGLCRVTTLMEKIDKTATATKRPITLFSTLITIPDTGIELPFDTVLGKTREINNIFDTSGAFAGSTSGNEIINERNMTLNATNDYVYYSASPEDTAVISNNILLRMLSGDKFNWVDESAKEWILNVIGTNGSVKRDKIAISEQPFKALFEQEGKLIIPNAIDDDGNTKLQHNTVITAFNRFNITIMLEFMYELNSVKKECYRYVYAIPGQASMTEGDDKNTFGSEVQLLCDVRTTDRFFLDGFGVNTKGRFEVSAIDATAAGTENITLGTDGVVEFGSNFTTYIDDANANLVYIKDLGPTDSGKSGYISVKKVGTDYKAIPLTIEQNGEESLSGAALEDYIMKIYDFDFIEQKFIQL